MNVRSEPLGPNSATFMLHLKKKELKSYLNTLKRRLCVTVSRYSPGLFSAGIRGQTPTSTLKRVAQTSPLLSPTIRRFFSLFCPLWFD